MHIMPCARTDPEVGKFTEAHRRASKTDMKHWRHRKVRDALGHLI